MVANAGGAKGILDSALGRAFMLIANLLFTMISEPIDPKFGSRRCPSLTLSDGWPAPKILRDEIRHGDIAPAPSAHGEDLWAGAEVVGNGSSTVLLMNSGEPRYQATGARSTTKITIATIHQTLLRIAPLLSIRLS